ncbi:MAG: DUF2652 domain-containing protein [Candidatus Promineifilaceae bacterium]
MSETHEGYFLIADITGYTRYLSESELVHAQETLTALLELLVENTRPPLVISRLAGDAVISYGLLENFFHWQTFIEKIEHTYVTFRKTLERLVLNNTCRCNACANISSLDLKFFIHFGAFGIQRISDHDELIGSDINLLHRLLKNSVTEETGIQGYALFTEAAIQQFGVEDIGEAMTPHSETYEYLGEVKVWVQDMNLVWEARRSEVATPFPEDSIGARIEVDIGMPLERAWDYLIQPEFRNTLIGTDRMEIANRAQGRIAPGSIYQCYHGDMLVPQIILEWQPFESMIVRELFPMSHAVSSLNEYRLDSTEKGTRLTRTISKPTGPFIWQALLRLLLPVFGRMTKKYTEAFVRRVEDDFRAHSESLEGDPDISGEQIREAAAAGLQASSGNLQAGNLQASGGTTE